MADANAFFKAGEKDDLTFSVTSTTKDLAGDLIPLTLASATFQLFIGPNTPMVTPTDFTTPITPTLDVKVGSTLEVRYTLDTANFPAGRYKGVFKIVDNTSKEYLWTYLIWVSDPKG